MSDEIRAAYRAHGGIWLYSHVPADVRIVAVMSDGTEIPCKLTMETTAEYNKGDDDGE